MSFNQEFIQFSLEHQILKFGEFVTKAGRLSPYFFNAGLFNTGNKLRVLGQFYAKAILNSGVEFDMLFGPAYKGISLAAATSIALAELGRDVPFAFNRKEVKDHGEGGNLIGAPLTGRVLVIDDVISAGTSVGESVTLINQNQAVLAGVVIALDRMEKGKGTQSAVQEVSERYSVPVISIANLNDLLFHLSQTDAADLKAFLPKVEAYRAQYGV